ncbi:uncharacterized protein [Drosophila takahashii]|uniref:uncharacterized protein n=1 Tax=Drosophila takahashii TaxID=29030 RepID=UPI003898E746
MSNEIAVAALARFITVSDRMSHFRATIETPGAAAPSVHTCKVRKEQVRSLWDKAEKEFEACLDTISSLTTDEASDILATLHRKYEYCYSVYEELSVQLSELIDRASSQQPLSSTDNQSAYIPSGCRLPPCDTEVFEGDYLKWPTFRDLFTAVYVNNTRLTPVEKLFHLNAKTSGEAKAIVAKSPLTNDGFASAWEALRDRFENKRLLVNSQLKLLFNLSSVNAETGHSIKELQSTIQGCLTALAHSKISTENWDCLLVYLCASKLPRLTLSLCEQSLTSKSDVPTWDEMNAFLSDRYRTLEAIEDMKQSLGGPSTSKNSQVTKKLNSFEAKSSQIDVLIGADILPSVLLSGTKTNICGSLFGQETIFGWVLTGPVSMSTSNRVSAFTTQITKTSEASLDKLLTKFWEVEDLPSKMVKESDSVCESNFLRTTTRDASGKYVVTLPFWDPDHCGSELGYSRSIALAQFLRNENRLRRDTPLNEQYNSVIQEYLDLGHMREVSPTHNSPNYYLPHHAVIKPESTTTKLRVVFNASSPSANGTSLNEEGDIRDYELKTVTFGVNCAPYLAIRVLKQLADDVDQQFPKASHIIRNFMYVDDVLAGSNSQQEAQLAIQELVTALNSAGFPLRKWTSNHKGVLKDIPNEHLLHSEFLNIDAESTAKTLGIRWRATTDEFYFVPPEISVKSSYTKREVLFQIAKLFDPAGWLAPFIVRAKIFMQEIWLQELGWDDNLPDEMSHRWQVFLQSYSDLDQIRIPRWVGYQPQVKIELHGFCDASQKAYGAALYVRVEVGQQILTNLLTAKTRVAPVKTVSLPRLELCGALLLADMASTILPNMLSKSSEIFCWTDSTIVLAWLKKPACSWTTFVANRITKIAQATKIENWSHVRSEHNPADLASRGVSLQELGDSNIWWHGPQWLQLPKLQWPETSDPHPVTELEQRAVKVHFVKLPADDFLDRFSRLDKALGVLAYVQRFLNRCRKAPGLLRACGRLTASKVLQYDERHPVLLPYSCRLSRLLVQFTHQITLHGGNQLIVRLMRSKYWIPKVKNLVKGVVNSCKVCTIYKKRLQTQLMGDFPTDRASFSRPFTYTGVDYAGPFEAIHLEPTSDLTTEKFLAAFARFVARRGCPQRVHSDNGKTFVGASSRISRDFTQALKESVTNAYSHQGLVWRFIPPGAPHMGGLWEAGVKSFKTLFYKSTSARKYTFEELSTLLAKIEACLNSRPLSPMSEDPTDLLALTPGHFLIGGPLLSTAEPEIKGEAQSIINRWQHLKAQHQQFSSRWKEEYLKELHKRNKWLSPSRNLQVDDMVVIKDDNLPSNDWLLGRIVAAIPGADTRVRVVDILTSRGTIQRPVHKLVLLPMEDKAISALPQ